MYFYWFFIISVFLKIPRNSGNFQNLKVTSNQNDGPEDACYFAADVVLRRPTYTLDNIQYNILYKDSRIRYVIYCLFDYILGIEITDSDLKTKHESEYNLNSLL